MLKHLHIIYQPTFAAAWIGEKGPAGSDTGPTMVEQALWGIRQRLPFVRLKGVLASEAPARAAHANFALCIADLHYQAGNLYFFKGNQKKQMSPTTGYLNQALYHYAVALHEVRRLHTHRCQSAQVKFAAIEGAASPIPRDILPDFALRRATSALFGLSGVWLAQISLEQLVWESYDGPKTAGGSKPSILEALQKRFNDWLCAAPVDRPDGSTTMSTWVGMWRATDPWCATEPECRHTLTAQCRRMIKDCRPE